MILCILVGLFSEEMKGVKGVSKVLLEINERLGQPTGTFLII